MSPALGHALLRLLSVLMLVLSCTGEEPVLQGVPSDVLLDEDAAVAPTAESGDDTLAPRSANPSLYEKPDYIYVDANWMGGRTFREAQPILQAQLGPQLAARALPSGKGDELTYERGTLRILDDRIYFVSIPLPAPLRRDLALTDLGFAPAVGKWLSTHRAYRLNNERGFRRLRLHRVDAESELVSTVEAWKWIPGEHGARR